MEDNFEDDFFFLTVPCLLLYPADFCRRKSIVLKTFKMSISLAFERPFGNDRTLLLLNQQTF